MSLLPLFQAYPVSRVGRVVFNITSQQENWQNHIVRRAYAMEDIAAAISGKYNLLCWYKKEWSTKSVIIGSF